MTGPAEARAASPRALGVALTGVAAFLTDGAFYLGLFALEHALEADGASNRAVALVFGLYNLAYAIAAPLLGGRSDRRRDLSVILGASLFAAAFSAVACALVLTLGAGGEVSVRARAGEVRWLIYGAMLTLAAANALFWPALQARLGDRITDAQELARAMRTFNVAWTAGKAAGFLAGGLLFPVAPQLSLVVVALAGWAIVATLVVDRGAEARAPRDERPAARMPVLQARKRAFLLAALLANFTLWGATSTLAALAPKLAQGWGISIRETGVLLSLSIVAQGAAFVWLGSGRRWAYRPALLALSVPCGALGLLALTTTSLALALVGAALVGAAQAVTYAASVFYSLDHDERRGLRTGIHEATLAAGGALPILGGQLADATDDVLVPLWLLLAIAVVLGLVLGIILLRAPADGGPGAAEGPER